MSVPRHEGKYLMTQICKKCLFKFEMKNEIFFILLEINLYYIYNEIETTFQHSDTNDSYNI